MDAKPLSNGPFARGTLFGMLVMLTADGAHWFITPSFDEASVLRNAAVAAQVLVCALGALWLYARERRAVRTALQSPA